MKLRGHIDGLPRGSSLNMCVTPPGVILATFPLRFFARTRTDRILERGIRLPHSGAGPTLPPPNKEVPQKSTPWALPLALNHAQASLPSLPTCGGVDQ